MDDSTKADVPLDPALEEELLTFFRRLAANQRELDLPMPEPDEHIDIDLRGVPGDIRFRCPVCGWQVTLKPEAVARWTENGAITPRCAHDSVDLIREEL